MVTFINSIISYLFMDINNPEVLRTIQEGDELYKDLCGNFGYGTFKNVVIPRLIYFSLTPSELKSRLENITDHAADHKPSEIDHFLESSTFQVPHGYTFAPKNVEALLSCWEEKSLGGDVYGFRGMGIESLERILITGGIIPRMNIDSFREKYYMNFSPSVKMFSYKNIKNRKFYNTQKENLNGLHKKGDSHIINLNRGYAKTNSFIDFIFKKGILLDPEFDVNGFFDHHPNLDFSYYDLYDWHFGYEISVLNPNPSEKFLKISSSQGFNPSETKNILDAAFLREGVQISFNKSILNYGGVIDDIVDSYITLPSNTVIPLSAISGIKFHKTEEKIELLEGLNS